MDENPIDQKARETIDKRIQEQKDDMLKALKVLPIVSVAVMKVGISKATFYRWEKEDRVFAQHVKEALKEGGSLVSDKAFSVFIKAGTDGQSWRASLELLKFLERQQAEKETDKPSVDLSTILSNPQALNALSEILKIASQNIQEKEKTDDTTT